MTAAAMAAGPAGFAAVLRGFLGRGIPVVSPSPRHALEPHVCLAQFVFRGGVPRGGLGHLPEVTEGALAAPKNSRIREFFPKFGRPPHQKNLGLLFAIRPLPHGNFWAPLPNLGSPLQGSTSPEVFLVSPPLRALGSPSVLAFLQVCPPTPPFWNPLPFLSGIFGVSPTHLLESALILGCPWKLLGSSMRFLELLNEIKLWSLTQGFQSSSPRPHAGFGRSLRFFRGSL